MAKTAIVPVVPVTDPVKVRTQGLQIIQPLQRAANELTVETAEDYLAADELLGRIRNGRMKWRLYMDPILSPLKAAAANIKEARKGADTLDKEIDGAAEALERHVKEQMRLYKVEEARLIEEARQEREAETRRLQLEAARVQVQEQKAATPQMKARLGQKRAELEQQAVEAAQAPAIDLNPVRGGSSSTRHITAPKITNLGAFLAALKDYEPKAGIYQMGAPPLSLIDVEALESAILRIYRDQPGVVKSWPGVEMKTTIQIAGR